MGRASTGDILSLLERLARRWRRRWFLGAALASGATGLFGAVLASRAGLRSPLGAGLAAGLALALILWRRYRPVDALVIARHLNRTVPTVEESADLLLQPAAALPAVQQLQRARVERVLNNMIPEPTLPSRLLRLAAGYAGVALLISVGLLTLAAPGTPGSTLDRSTPSASQRPLAAPTITRMTITVAPPSYTGNPVRRGSAWDQDVEQGARVTWQLELDRPVSALRLVTTDGDSLNGASVGAGRFTVSLTAGHALLYQILLMDSLRSAATDYHRLTVTPDAPPTLTVVRPEPRTDVAFGASPIVPLEVLANDDYGLNDARIVATLTTGAGEAVKFREQTLEFDASRPRPGSRHAVVLEKRIDVRGLAMQPGDELYFYVVAHDRRRPEPNEARSETFFISLTDTAHLVMADLSGLAINTVPEYLRSQRQIIIDTEVLLGQAATLDAATVRDRSNNIGLDQHALRERYGEIVGQEDVEAGTSPVIEHEHDTPESATLLAQSVKDTLQAAVAQMWEAELRLRTSRPRAALPYEYRALELLKQAQQAARIYVLRVGFEPPPLEPDRKRLTGTLTAIGNPSRQREATPTPVLASVQEALPVVQRLRTGASPEPGDEQVLRRAADEIARLVIAAPGAHLETLRDLRVLIDGLRGVAAACTECAARVEKGLWNALPPAEPNLQGRARPSGLARDYFDRLQSERP